VTERPAPLHLRLVSAQETGKEKLAKPTQRRDKQLSFPYPDASTVFLVYVEALGKEEFARILGNYAPRWIIDVRAVPRLDTIAASRLSAFSLFERTKASYVDLFGRLGIKSYRSVESNPAFWGSAVFDLLKDTERRGPYLFLFDNEQMLRVADHVLPDVIMPAIGKTARFAHIGHLGSEHQLPD
jgi:hypothetical protein